MKTKVRYLIILFTLIIISCEDDKFELDITTSINFDIKKSNSDNNYIAKIEQEINTAEKTSHFHYGTDSVRLIQEILFDLHLKNGDTINFGFWLIGYEQPELLNLGKYDTVYYDGEDWDYIDFDYELRNFYNDPFLTWGTSSLSPPEKPMGLTTSVHPETANF